MNKRYLFVVLITSLFFVASCSNINKNDSNLKTSELVVRSYFESWNSKDYKTQYDQISDGFKRIDPNAKDLSIFSKYSAKFFEQANGIEIVSIKEVLNDGETATVDYTINIIKEDGSKTKFSSTYTLRFRENGWKLIHPYGENIDTS